MVLIARPSEATHDFFNAVILISECAGPEPAAVALGRGVDETEASTYHSGQYGASKFNRVSDCLTRAMAVNVELAIQNNLTEVSRVADELMRLATDCSIANDVLSDLQVAADEILSNIIKYGNSGSGQLTITVRLRVMPNEVTMEFVDDGTAFDPRDAPAPPSGQGLSDRQMGGLGIQFVKALIDSIEYERINGRNHLRLRKKCSTTVTQDTRTRGR